MMTVKDYCEKWLRAAADDAMNLHPMDRVAALKTLGQMLDDIAERVARRAERKDGA